MIRVLFFGRLADIAGARMLEAPDACQSLEGVRAWAGRENNALAHALSASSVKIALNQKLEANLNTHVRAGDEVAFMPPLSGG